MWDENFPFYSPKIAGSQLDAFYKNYVTSFFAPTERRVLKPGEFLHTYHLQLKESNPAERKNPGLFAKLTSMRVNFNSIQVQNATIDPLHKMHRREAEMRKESARDPELTVNKAVLQMSMNEIFNIPRNEVSHPRHRHAVGSYIYGKFGRLGLFTHMQQFRASRPKIGGLADDEVGKRDEFHIN